MPCGRPEELPHRPDPAYAAEKQASCSSRSNSAAESAGCIRSSCLHSFLFPLFSFLSFLEGDSHLFFPYARCKTIVEPVFGQIKNSGFRGFGLRGKEKVAGEFSLVCAAHNLKKIIFAALRGEVCPEFGKRVAWA